MFKNIFFCFEVVYTKPTLRDRIKDIYLDVGWEFQEYYNDFFQKMLVGKAFKNDYKNEVKTNKNKPKINKQYYKKN